ncbi:lipoyl(octanoyl) transferase LipB [Cuniculiplasma sp. SKW4]|uniref:lipoyl(octanoyl) transferase LipB n=1 Tax=Cuniculiplasma sp. SKW4 TaxID=3400171 RepID=UPI003FD54190
MISGEDWRSNFKDTKIYILNGGIEPYHQILNLQRELNRRVNEEECVGYLLVLEHKDVYTCGIHTEHIDSRIPEPVRIERGGSITYHGPGQLVVYYILNMKHLQTNILGIISKAHESEIDLLEGMGIIGAESKLGKETGIWVGTKKIASTGFAIRMNSTLHGTALNIQPDLDKFSFINPCGLNWDIMTSIEKETGKKYNMSEVKERAIQAIIRNFRLWNYEKKSLSEQLSETAP